MRKCPPFILMILFPLLLQGQTGTIGDPFTSLDHSFTVSSAGIYYFNLGGTTFDTYVDANGYVQVALDFGNGSGSLPQSNSLNASTRGILNAATLASLTSTVEVRISTSTGNIDVTTTNATIISRLQNNQTFHRGSSDNGINNGWTGTNSARLTNNASCGSPHGTTLNANIIHPCGNASTFHWMPSNSTQREIWTAGEAAASVAFRIWVRGTNILPITLVNFSVKPNHRSVTIEWTTASETNNDFFSIERSSNGEQWQTIGLIKGGGNSTETLQYQFNDDPYQNGLFYYRLKQTDFDGRFSYSPIISIILNDQLSAYPNPCQDQLSIVSPNKAIHQVQLTSLNGQTIRPLKPLVKQNETYTFDLSDVPPGLYLIKTDSKVYRIIKT